MAEINYETLHDFVIKNGDLKVADTSGKTSLVKPEDNPAIVFELIKNANRFWFNERWYAREAFQELLDDQTK